jgi:3-isopropylmalate dehydrogenase
MRYRIAAIPGDGIGPEIVDSALGVLRAAGRRYGHTFDVKMLPAGGCAIDQTGEPLPPSTLEACLASDSVLLGAVGGPKWEDLPGHLRPERALLGIRKAMNLFANLRPAKLLSVLSAACPLREDIAAAGFDMLIVRELTGGMYFGKSGREQGPFGETAFDTESYGVGEVERIAHIAFDAARKRGRRLTNIDKANVLESSRLWRETVHRIAAQYPDVEVRDMLVDNAAMQLVARPSQFDVILTSNMFGDILSDEASQLTGSIGLLASASLGDGTRGMYEPIHGSAPDIAGQGLANPIATILSAAMMLRMSFNLPEEAAAIESAVEKALADGYRTRDIAAGGEFVTCRQMTNCILAALK